jgi:hypothetical protein
VRQASREQRSIAELALRLCERREEIEAATLTRIFAVSDLPLTGGPEYAQGLRRAVTAALDYGLVGLERSGAMGSPPPVLLTQAALAARSGVGLDTVLRRYVAGHAILGDFVVEEDGGHLSPADLKRTLRRLAAAIDRLLSAVSTAYDEELQHERHGAEQRRSELVERLLAGEPLDHAELGYDLEAWHLGVLASGTSAAGLLTSLSRRLDARLLTVARGKAVAWAWLGRSRQFDVADALRRASALRPVGVALAFGEPENGPTGWRLTHHQAAAAASIAQRALTPVVRYREVALLAAALQDDLLGSSLRRLYLDPLRAGRSGGATLLETLHAYYAAGRNISSAAAGLRVDRRTVSSRLRVAEERIGSPLDDCVSDLEIALKLDRLDRPQRA